MNSDPASLDRLHDIVAPPPVPWWPPAPGWRIVLGFALAILLVLAVRSVLRWQRNRYRREAMAEWKRHEALLHDPARRAGALAAMAELLKRTALSAWPREQVASLTGANWLAFLDHTGSTGVFSSGLGTTLEGAAYDSRCVAALDESCALAIASAVRQWIIRHRVGGTGRC